ncbi:MAG: nucleoside-diphosphate sugar epimerase, partial [Candidatus Omnitrophica bacterium]|nr:nucleoside-diphosphate sugar epimerase [Candidatus Omnitrophota bacterium]
EEISILDLAKKVVEKTGSKSEIKVIPYEEAYSAGFEDMQRRVPDLSRIHALLGYQPKHTLEDILEDV